PPASPRPPSPAAPETGPEAPATPGAETTVASSVAAAAESPTDAVPGATPGGLANGIIGGMVRGVLAASSAGMLPVAPPPPSATERAAWEEEYFETMFRDRFENVRYPHQAAVAGIEGRFAVRISVDARGRLLALAVVGTCPHYVLCDAAMQAVREAAPFPPPPAALGAPVTVELPFNYHLR
ncbi:energy transducer TonB, partial [Myxococcus sp. K15C18031901]|uniref:TonB family protein n=1 Tax=Myxococcus dinghuensis TaxID=2906761 RepID=UPI0020A805A6